MKEQGINLLNTQGIYQKRLARKHVAKRLLNFLTAHCPSSARISAVQTRMEQERKREETKVS